jgi:hypothetical protein
MNETGQFQELKTELRVGMQQLRTEMQQLRGDVFAQLRANQRQTVGLLIGLYATSIVTLLVVFFKAHS